MTTPTPDEIANAIMLLQSVPGIRGTDTLDQIENSNTPFRRMAADLRGWWTKSMSPNAVDLEIELRAAAARHGLRITTDPAAPGRLVGYQMLSEAPDGLWPWKHRDAGNWFVPNPAGLDAIQRDAIDGLHAAAVYLLPEGGHA